MALDDRRLMEELVTAMNEELVHVLRDHWQTSQSATILALSRSLAVFIVEHLKDHPDHRASVCAMLERLMACVEETASNVSAGEQVTH